MWTKAKLSADALMSGRSCLLLHVTVGTSTHVGMAFDIAHRNVIKGQIKRQVLNDTWLIEAF